jgi:hypothetical protein
MAPPGVVVVVTEAQLPAAQASQQLGASPTHIEPPLGGVHAAAPDFTEHVFLPLAVVRQQAMAPGRPQVDCLAHFATSARQDFGRLPPFTAVFATRATHWTYERCPAAEAQGHCCSASARTDVTDSRSVHAARTVATGRDNETTTNTASFMAASSPG